MRRTTSKTKNNKQSLEKIMENAYVINEVKTDSAATIANASTYNTVNADASNPDNDGLMNFPSLYSINQYYFFEDDPLFNKIIKNSKDEKVSRMAVTLYADCDTWNRCVNRFNRLSDSDNSKLQLGIWLIKSGYGIIARKDLFYSMFVNTDSSEIKTTHFPEDIESYTIRDIIYKIDTMYHFIFDTVSVITEYGYKNPEVILAMEFVNCNGM